MFSIHMEVLETTFKFYRTYVFLRVILFSCEQRSLMNWFFRPSVRLSVSLCETFSNVTFFANTLLLKSPTL